MILQIYHINLDLRNISAFFLQFFFIITHLLHFGLRLSIFVVLIHSYAES